MVGSVLIWKFLLLFVLLIGFEQLGQCALIRGEVNHRTLEATELSQNLRFGLLEDIPISNPNREIMCSSSVRLFFCQSDSRVGAMSVAGNKRNFVIGVNNNGSDSGRNGCQREGVSSCIYNIKFDVISDIAVFQETTGCLPILSFHPLLNCDFLKFYLSGHTVRLAFNDIERLQRGIDTSNSNKDQEQRWQVCGTKKGAEVSIRFAGGCYCLLFGCLLVYGNISGQSFKLRLRRIFGLTLIGLGLAAFLFPPYYEGDCENSGDQPIPFSNPFHTGNTVPQKYLLTSHNYWGTVMGIGDTQMPNVLPMEKQVAVISALAEGSGIRQIERITGVHRDTIMRLGVRVGQGCADLLDRKMRNLTCEHLQFDEIWGFIGKKERHCTVDDDPKIGDAWTFCAIDSDTKLVPAFKVGKRDSMTANAFVRDVASRVNNRVQISSDALRAYVEAVEQAFGANVDFAQIVKTYVHDESQNTERKYSAAEFVIEEKKSISGFPDMALASTSHVERLNGTTRLHMRRLTRLTYAFSKKRENFEAAVALHFTYYNFVKRHGTLRTTPAMAAGIERDFWTVGNLLEAVV